MTTPLLKRAYTKKSEVAPTVTESPLGEEDHIIAAIAGFLSSKMPGKMKIKMIRTIIDAFDDAK